MVQRAEDIENTQRRYAYPEDLARFAQEVWEGCSDNPQYPQDGGESEYGLTEPVESPHGSDCPEELVLEMLFSVCYQAGLLREEERPVTFRVIFAPPEAFPEEDGPPFGLHRIEFDEPRTFDEFELRRISPAADFERSLIGVCLDEHGEMKIWGFIHSGSRWLRAAQGGRQTSAPLPLVPVVKVDAPGRLMVKKGSAFVAELAGGRIVSSRSDIFTSQWLADFFAPTRDEVLRLHNEARLEAEALGEPWAPLDLNLPGAIARQMYRRLIFTLSEARHGGTIVLLPPERIADMLSGENVALKHTVADGEPRRRLKTLIVGIMNRLAQSHGKGGKAAYPRSVGWKEYARSEDPELAELDEAVFEFAHLVAGLASVDGAVVITHQGELLGFGGEISGELEPVISIERALDPEGETTLQESAENFGTRHRSAYRLAGALKDSLLVVVSQDGNVRFAADREGMVTCWDQA